jgi:hypothetical protein
MIAEYAEMLEKKKKNCLPELKKVIIYTEGELQPRKPASPAWR